MVGLPTARPMVRLHPAIVEWWEMEGSCGDPSLKLGLMQHDGQKVQTPMIRHNAHRRHVFHHRRLCTHRRSVHLGHARPHLCRHVRHPLQRLIVCSRDPQSAPTVACELKAVKDKACREWGKRAGTSLCTCLYNTQNSQKEVHFAVARLKMDLPLHNRLAFTGRSASNWETMYVYFLFGERCLYGFLQTSMLGVI